MIDVYADMCYFKHRMIMSFGLTESDIDMRMRKKPNLQPRMEKCSSVLINEPTAIRGAWQSSFPDKKIWLEIGCGKGRFTVGTAQEHPEAMLIALEKVEDAMVIAMERACAEQVENVRFISIDALKLRELFAPGEAACIFLNFCDPWPKSRDAKHRLTSPNFLRIYADVLPLGGKLCFKTDNLPLFEWSLEQMRAEGWELCDVTNDLHENGEGGVMTDYECKFREQGIKINRLVAVKTAETRNGDSGEIPRLRNAALSDARGN